MQIENYRPFIEDNKEHLPAGFTENPPTPRLRRAGRERKKYLYSLVWLDVSTLE